MQAGPRAIDASRKWPRAGSPATSDRGGKRNPANIPKPTFRLGPEQVISH